jgi:beta-1,4-mannosyltransferase
VPTLRPATDGPLPLRVSAWPGFEIGRENPYTKLLYSAVSDQSVIVDDFRLWRALWRRYDILHVHWPEYYIAHPNPVKAALGTVAQLFCLRWLRLRGTKVVWTVHNLGSHHHRRPHWERRYWPVFTRQVDGFCALTSAGMEQARDHYPGLRDLPGFVVPHGVYEDAYPNQVGHAEARERFGFQPQQPVILLLGNIVRYKNVPGLVSAFQGLNDPEARLVIAGGFVTPQDEVEVREAAARDPRVQLHTGYVPGEELQWYFNAADLVVLPFRQILNSGSAILALSFKRPVLVPALGAMPELQAAFGPEWVRIYRGELTAEELQAALQWARGSQGSAPRRSPAPTWHEIAQKTIRAYRAILERDAVASEQAANL